MDERNLIFVLPPNSELISGGNIYNQHFIAALAALQPVRTLPVDRWVHELASSGPGIPLPGTHLIDSLCMAELAACLPQRRHGQRFVLIVHYLPSLGPAHEASPELLETERFVVSHVDGFLVTSPYTRDVLLARGVPGERIATVLPALPERDIPRLEYRPGFRGLMVSAVTRLKGVPELLEELARALGPGERTGPDLGLDFRLDPRLDFRLDIVGRTDMEPAAARACMELVAATDSLRNAVRIRGPVAYADLDAYYRAATVFVSASNMETFGMALQEARSYGLPILAHDRGNVRHHVEHGKTGLLFGSIADLATGIVTLARDPARTQALFQAAQQQRSSQQYTWRAAAASFVDQLSAFGTPQ